MLTRRSRFDLCLAAVGLGALAARLGVVAWIGDAPGYVGGDQTTYLTLSESVIGGTYPIIRVPGYPAFLAFALGAGARIVPDWSDRMVIGTFQALLGAGTVVLTGLLGRRLSTPSVGIIAAVLVAVWPSLLLMTAVTLTETLFIALFLAALTALFWSEVPSRMSAATAGVLLGGAYLVRPVAIVALVIAGGWLIRRSGTAAWPALWRMVLGALLVVLPWIGRNAWAYGAFIPGDTSGGYSWCIANRDDADPRRGLQYDCLDLLPGETAIEGDRRLTRRAMSWIVANPGTFAGMLPERADVLVATDDDTINELNSRYPAQAQWTPDEAQRLRDALNLWWRTARWFALAGFVLMVADRRQRWVILVGGSILIPPIAAAVAPRYHLPFVPVMAIAIAIAIRWIWNAARAEPDTATTTSAPVPPGFG